MAEYQHPIVDYSNLAYQRRGLIINHTIDLEYYIDLYIAGKFAKTKELREEMCETVMSKLSLSHKLNMLNDIILKYNPHLYETYPKMAKDLQKIRKVRNDMAHTILNITPTFVANRGKLKQGVTKFRNKNPIEFNEKRVMLLAQMINIYVTVFYAMCAAQ